MSKTLYTNLTNIDKIPITKNISPARLVFAHKKIDKKEATNAKNTSTTNNKNDQLLRSYDTTTNSSEYTRTISTIFAKKVI